MALAPMIICVQSLLVCVFRLSLTDLLAAAKSPEQRKVYHLHLAPKQLLLLPGEHEDAELLPNTEHDGNEAADTHTQQPTAADIAAELMVLFPAAHANGHHDLSVPGAATSRAMQQDTSNVPFGRQAMPAGHAVQAAAQSGMPTSLTAAPQQHDTPLSEAAAMLAAAGAVQSQLPQPAHSQLQPLHPIVQQHPQATSHMSTSTTTSATANPATTTTSDVVAAAVHAVDAAAAHAAQVAALPSATAATAAAQSAGMMMSAAPGAALPPVDAAALSTGAPAVHPPGMPLQPAVAVPTAMLQPPMVATTAPDNPGLLAAAVVPSTSLPQLPLHMMPGASSGVAPAHLSAGQPLQGMQTMQTMQHMQAVQPAAAAAASQPQLMSRMPLPAATALPPYTSQAYNMSTAGPAAGQPVAMGGFAPHVGMPPAAAAGGGVMMPTSSFPTASGLGGGPHMT